MKKRYDELEDIRMALGSLLLRLESDYRTNATNHIARASLQLLEASSVLKREMEKNDESKRIADYIK